jgi:hypothetical protein
LRRGSAENQAKANLVVFLKNYRDIFGAAREFFLMNTRRKLGLHAQN